MKMMRWRVEFFGEMATGASPVPGTVESQAVRVVAVTTSDSRVVHLALQEGSIDIDFIQDLPVGMVERISQQ